MRIGYARCSTADQDLTAQRQQLAGFRAEQIFTDHGLTGTTRESPDSVKLWQLPGPETL